MIISIKMTLLVTTFIELLFDNSEFIFFFLKKSLTQQPVVYIFSKSVHMLFYVIYIYVYKERKAIQGLV